MQGLRLVEQLTASFAGSSDEQEARLFAAAARGDEVMDVLEFALPEAAGPACVQLEALLDEADEYCRAGHHLLTLATPDGTGGYNTYSTSIVDSIEFAGGVPLMRLADGRTALGTDIVRAR